MTECELQSNTTVDVYDRIAVASKCVRIENRDDVGNKMSRAIVFIIRSQVRQAQKGGDLNSGIRSWLQACNPAVFQKSKSQVRKERWEECPIFSSCLSCSDSRAE